MTAQEYAERLASVYTHLLTAPFVAFVLIIVALGIAAVAFLERNSK